jgi:hypothetical protein
LARGQSQFNCRLLREDGESRTAASPLLVFESLMRIPGCLCNAADAARSLATLRVYQRWARSAGATTQAANASVAAVADPSPPVGGEPHDDGETVPAAAGSSCTLALSKPASSQAKPPPDWHKRGVWIDPALIGQRMADTDVGDAAHAKEPETAVAKSLTGLIRVRAEPMQRRTLPTKHTTSVLSVPRRCMRIRNISNGLLLFWSC